MTSRLAVALFMPSLAIASACAERNERPDQESPDCGCDDQPDGGSCVDTEQPEPDGGVSGWRMTWAAQAGGTVEDEIEKGYELVRDLQPLPDSSVLVTGRYNSEAVFGAGEPNETMLPAFVPGDSEDENDFVARYDPRGELLWADGFGGVGIDAGGMSVGTAGDESLWVVAAYEEEMTIGLGQPNETTLLTDSFEASGLYSHVLARYSVDGAFEWATRASDAAAGSFLLGGGALPDGSVVVGGSFSLGIALAPDTPEETIFTTAGSGDEDAVLVRFNADGSLAWARQLSSPGIEEVTSVVRLLGGEVLTTGGYQNTIVLGAGEPNETWLTCGDSEADSGPDSEGKYCPFLAAYDENGALLWARYPGVSCALCGCFVVATAAPDGGFAISTSFAGTGVLGEGEPNETTIGPVPEDGFGVVLARYNADGALLWARLLLDDTDDWIDLLGLPLAFLDSGELVVASTYRYGAPVFGEGEPNETTLPDTNAYRFFVSMFYPNGNLAWAFSPEGDCDGNTVGAVAAYGDSTFFVGGSFGNTVDFGTSSADRVPMTANGDSDIFVLRFDRTGDL